MFDIGFSELMIIGIVALVVIGPERLPKVARTAGQWLGRLNRYVSQVKQDIDRDIKLEELRKMQQDMKETAQRYEVMAGNVAREVETTVEQETSDMSRVMQALTAPDVGLAMQELDKSRAEVAADETPALPRSAGTGSGAAQSTPSPAPSQPITQTADNQTEINKAAG
jgi:sec-independent protein translocase protein TatB